MIEPIRGGFYNKLYWRITKMKKYGKKILFNYVRCLDNEEFEVLVCDGGEYYDIHLISERYRDDEMNTLKLQETKECIDEPKSYFTNEYMIGILMEHFIWDRFYNEGIFIGSLEIKFEKHEEVA